MTGTGVKLRTKALGQFCGIFVAMSYHTGCVQVYWVFFQFFASFAYFFAPFAVKKDYTQRAQRR